MKTETAIKIRGYHIDHFGHVNHARYIEFLEEARLVYTETNQRSMEVSDASPTMPFRFYFNDIPESQ